MPRHIKLVTDIPGPNSRALLERRAAAVSAGSARATDIVVDCAEGALVHDVDGNTLIDLAGGIGMLAAGHCPPPVVEAMKAQADRLVHVCNIVATYEPYVALCELLNEVTPGDFPKKTLLANSGAEAVENAVKVARRFTGRQGIVVFEGAYHGRTNLTMAMTSKWSLFKRGFGPFAPEVHRLPVPNMYRRPAGMTADEYLCWSLQQLDNALIAHIEPGAIAAIVIEPILGEAGFVPVPAEFLQRIRAICDEHGIVMIADEIQCGMGRTGELWACEHFGVAPDVITTAKSLGSGMPISATVGRADIMDSPHVGGVGGTYGGAPLACQAAIESIRMINTPKFLAHANHLGEIMRETLESWRDRFDLIGDVRGLGPMRLIEFVRDRETKEPAPDETLAIIRAGVKRGLLLIRAGLYANGIRLMPPLNTPEEILREGLGELGAAIAEHHAG